MSHDLDDTRPNLSRREWREQLAAARSPFGGPAAVDAMSSPEGSETPVTILTVCTGNICRSPMAEVLLRARLRDLGVRVHSAGTHALVGHGMTPQAQEIAVQRGAREADASAHAARYLVEPLLMESDLVITMTREHRSHVVQMVPQLMKRAFPVREFARLAATLTTDEARAAADAAGGDVHARVRAALRAVTDQRGKTPADQSNDDVIDPYRRSGEVYEQSANELLPALDEVERILRAALEKQRN